ncbi:hypothetical protein G5C66_18900 [Nocardioides sp. KC13]|uniref:Uncharacterized protein n=1 Tax=Nocardioides turkmenicus TaxID=2711220 RepID=A0A6M1QXR6_9ACTN|nr:hypothetical protein [Nocardioides sp. KC13]NGN94795.1 hypothetical protein [Nocardioides sp. KC13]
MTIDHVEIFRIMADPATGRAVRAAAEAALEDGSDTPIRYFIDVGHYEV